jgi:hypothetical protein
LRPSTLHVWFDWNAGDVLACVVINEPSSNPKAGIAPPRLLRKNKIARIDLAEHIALAPLLIVKRRRETMNGPLAYVTRQQMCQDKFTGGTLKKM